MKLVELVGENIASRRKHLGLSQKELAARLCITQDAMARMEKGKIAPKMSRLDDIAHHLDCPVTYFFRHHNNIVEERAATIVDILSTVPDEGQEAIVHLVIETASVMNFLRNR